MTSRFCCNMKQYSICLRALLNTAQSRNDSKTLPESTLSTVDKDEFTPCSSMNPDIIAHENIERLLILELETNIRGNHGDMGLEIRSFRCHMNLSLRRSMLNKSKKLIIR